MVEARLAVISPRGLAETLRTSSVTPLVASDGAWFASAVRSTTSHADARAVPAAGHPPRSLARGRVAALVVLAGVGFGIVALPDTGARLVTFSATHGPSALDAVGLVVLLAAWLPVPVLLVRRRGFIPPRIWAAAAAITVVAVAALATAVRSDMAWWWAPGVVLFLVQAVLVGVALARGRTGT